MEKSRNFKLAANLIMGDRPEPFLPYCLESIREGVDLAVINDNSNNKENPNLAMVKNSTLYREGRVDLLYSDFKELGGFAAARNLCLDRVKELQDKGDLPLENLWILYLDCDEVHPPGFANFTGDFVANVPPRVGIVDGYMYQFILTFDYYTTLERRHNLFFRFHPEIRWERPVHETLVNLQGERIATGYTYNHYGYMLPPDDLMERWKLYDQFDGLDFNLDQVEKGEMLMEKSALSIPFAKEHPPGLGDYIREFNANLNPLSRKYLEKVEMERKNPGIFVKNLLRHINYEVRLAFRNIQAGKYEK